MFKEKYNEGKALRGATSRELHATWKPPLQRPSVVDMIATSNDNRLPDLVPIRHFRMAVSPFAFYRATASVMAGDLAALPSSGIDVQVCGDCHLANFGGFATPERTLILDMNDFDETTIAPWEWDLKRLSTSFVLACRDNGFSDIDAVEVTMAMVSSYQKMVNKYARMNFLDLWYTKFPVKELQKNSKSREVRERLGKVVNKAERQTHDQIFYKITASTLGKIQISDQPPLVYHPHDIEKSRREIDAFIDQYKQTLQPDRQILLDRYHMVDLALKVVGVGSVGTRCYVALLMNDDNEPLFLQIKEARPSVLERYGHPGRFSHSGERVVQGQRLIQAASDIFLGWATGLEGRHFYLRQLRDKKLSPQIAGYDKQLMTDYGRICGKILARSHCKTAQGPFICGYIGKSDKFAEAICRFALRYADQTEKDYDTFIHAVRAGKLPIKQEIPADITVR